MWKSTRKGRTHNLRLNHLKVSTQFEVWFCLQMISFPNSVVLNWFWRLMWNVASNVIVNVPIHKAWMVIVLFLLYVILSTSVQVGWPLKNYVSSCSINFAHSASDEHVRYSNFYFIYEYVLIRPIWHMFTSTLVINA